MGGKMRDSGPSRPIRTGECFHRLPYGEETDADSRAPSSRDNRANGHFTLTRLPSGDFNVDSFFDVTCEISWTGAGRPEWEEEGENEYPLEGFTRTTPTDTIHFEQGCDYVGETPSEEACEVETFTITRSMELHFSEDDPEGLSSPGWLDNQLGGTCREEVTGLIVNKALERDQQGNVTREVDETTNAEGVFRLRRVADLATPNSPIPGEE